MYINWRVSGGGTINVIASTRDDPFTLVVRCREGQLDIFVDWDMVVTYADEILIEWQFDNGQRQRANWGVGTQHDSTFAPEHRTLEIIRFLRQAQVLRVWGFPVGAGRIQATFDVSGFDVEAGPLLRAWQLAGSPVPRRQVEGGGCFLLPATFVAVLIVIATVA